MKRKVLSLFILCLVLFSSACTSPGVKEPEKPSDPTMPDTQPTPMPDTQPTPNEAKTMEATQTDPLVTQDENTVHPIEEEHVVIDNEKEDGYIDNIIVLILKPEVKDEDVLSWFSGEDARIVGRFPRLHQLQVRIKPRNRQALEALANELMAKDQVLYAHLDLAGSTVGGNSMARQASEEAPGNEGDDTWPDAPSQQKPENEWWYEVIKLKEAQASMPKDFVKVAVVDDGFDTTHPDLNLTYISKEQENMSSPQDHGTHVAGIVQQMMPGAQITVLDSYRFPGKVEMGQYATQCHHLKFLVDLVEAGMKVINYSMGSDIPMDANIAWDVESSSINSVYIWLLKQQGQDFILVQSAGNSGLDVYRNGYFSTLNAENCLGSEVVRKSLGVNEHLEAAQKEVFDSIVLVGAFEEKTRDGKYPLIRSSNYGEGVTIVAPGYEIRSTVPGGYEVMGGTSQSAPIVAGGLGFLWSLDKTLTSDQLKQILIKTSTEVAYDLVEGRPADKRQTYPIFNLLEAVKFVQKDG